MNNNILKIECGGVEHANDLRDERNALLDELGSLIHIEYKEDFDGAVLVKAEGHQLVTRSGYFTIDLDRDSNTGFYTPYWKADAREITLDDGTVIPDLSNSKVFDLTQTISTAKNNDIGIIKAQLLARGDHRANYTDAERSQDDYNANISQSVVMSVQAEFDKLVHTIAIKINEALAASADADNGYLVDKDGNPIQIFQKISTPGYDESGNYIPEDYTPGEENTLYTISNMMINPDLKKEPALLGFVKPDEKEDFIKTIEMLQSVFTAEEHILNPNVTNRTNLTDFYSNIVSQVAYQGSVFKSVYENQTTTVESTEYARQQVVGVSDDEELSHMIRFQNAYNASSRYINAINEMIEHIINRLGS